MNSDELILERLSENGSIGHSEWPSLLDRLLPRLDEIVYNNFPTPSIPLSEPIAPPINEASPTARASPSSPSSSSSQKENQHTASPNNPTTSVVPPSGTLPPPLVTLLNTVKSSLTTSFRASPPHTAQRLAELLLHPTRHYRTLPSYLRALDRIVCVSSPLSAFPLPAIASASTTNGGILNGYSSPEREQDDETLSGATLTPIPWLRRGGTSPSRTSSTSSVHPHAQHHATASDLRTESTTQIDGPNGAGSIETVTVAVNGLNNRPSTPGATTSSVSNGTPVTQGELLRQEQEAGVVPVPVQTPMVSMAASQGRVTRSSSASATAAQISADAETVMPLDESEFEEGTRVHARGPDIIGMEDMGPQASPAGVGGLDIEGAVGRRGEGEGMLFGSSGMERGERVEEEKKLDDDPNIIVTDADGIVEGDEGADTTGQNVGGDAADSSTMT